MEEMTGSSDWWKAGMMHMRFIGDSVISILVMLWWCMWRFCSMVLLKSHTSYIFVYIPLYFNYYLCACLCLFFIFMSNVDKSTEDSYLCSEKGNTTWMTFYQMLSIKIDLIWCLLELNKILDVFPVLMFANNVSFIFNCYSTNFFQNTNYFLFLYIYIFFFC